MKKKQNNSIFIEFRNCFLWTKDLKVYRLMQNTTKICNTKSYMITALYNSFAKIHCIFFAHLQAYIYILAYMKNCGKIANILDFLIK